jgi:hypothetical protein
MNPLSRRRFLALGAGSLLLPAWSRDALPGLAGLPPEVAFHRDWLGTTLVEGQYHLSSAPALLEGADQMLALGTRVGKFWFEPHRAARDYPWHSRWPAMHTLVELAASPYWQAVWRRPFRTLFLVTHSPAERAWNADHDQAYYATIEAEWTELATWFYTHLGDRELTLVLQNWEGDWQLRGTGERWDPPPPDWARRCERYARRLAARQAAVGRVRAAHPGARLSLLHAAEVNRVADHWRGVPTMTEHVLPRLTVDLVSYSCYDGMADGATLARALTTIRRFARTDGPLGPGALCLGEIGIPEMARSDNIAARWQDLLGIARADGVHWVVQWALYCNEADNRRAPPPKPPVTDPRRLQGYWLLRPDGTPSETGRYFQDLWRPDLGVGG